MAAQTTRVEVLSKTNRLPLEFIPPSDETPTQTATVDLPVISLSALRSADAALRHREVAEMLRAAADWGIFQLVDAGISDDLIRRFQDAGRRFFEDVPIEKKEEYCDLSTGDRFEGYGTKLACTASDTRQGWSDFYFHMLWPPAVTDMCRWPAYPTWYQPVASQYAREVLHVADAVLRGLSVALGLVDEGRLRWALGGEDMEMELKMNYYPPCPAPHLALGVVPHTDMSALTVLRSNGVPGLQVLRHGCWVPVRHRPEAFVVHIGDQLAILTKGRLKSMVHRTVVRKKEMRMSWAVFCMPPLDHVVAPLPELNDSEENNDARSLPTLSYRDYKRYRLLKGHGSQVN